jgi:hypothetical protein
MGTVRTSPVEWKDTNQGRGRYWVRADGSWCVDLIACPVSLFEPREDFLGIVLIQTADVGSACSTVPAPLSLA